MRLAELQAAFALGLRDGTMPTALVAAVADGAISAERRLGLHRNHVRRTLEDALAIHYPVLRRLLGADAFAALSGAFLAACPPADPRLAHYGAGLPAFVATVAAVDRLPYLADLARLEWARLELARSPAPQPLTQEALAAIAPDRLATLRLPLTAARLLATDYAADCLWEANQPGRDGVPDGPVAAPRRLLLRRAADGQILCSHLDPASFAFLATLDRGETLGAAAEAALGVDPAASLGEILALALRRQVLACWRGDSRSADAPSA